MATTAPHSQEGLRFYDLSHPWGKNTTVWPGFPDVRFIRRSFHAQHGTQTEGFSTVMHASTHINAPLHLDAFGQGVGDIPLETFFGRAVIVSIPKGKWELIEIDDLEAAQPQIEAALMALSRWSPRTTSATSSPCSSLARSVLIDCSAGIPSCSARASIVVMPGVANFSKAGVSGC